MKDSNTDSTRLAYLMKDGCDGFFHVKKDRYEYAMEQAEAAGRDEPNEEDELNGFRLLIDEAIRRDDELAKGWQ